VIYNLWTSSISVSLVAEHWPRQCVSTTLCVKKIIRVMRDRHAAFQTVFLSWLSKHTALESEFFTLLLTGTWAVLLLETLRFCLPL